MNRIIITGRMVRDAEIKTTASGTEVCNFTVAVDRFAKKGEERQTDFFDCTAWGRSAAFVNTYFHKGDGINIEGRMESRKWVDKDGNNRFGWSLIAEKMEFPHGKNKSDNASQFAEPGGTDFTELTDDEDLPF